MSEGGVRTALVTGGNRGLGFQTCLRLRDLGYDVVLTARDAAGAQAAADSLGVRWAHLDTADPESVRRTCAGLGARGTRVDVLVNNAAVLIEDGPLEISEADLGITFATNVFGPWLLVRALLPRMIERGFGRAVNVSSAAGSFGDGGPTLGTYGISKAALDALTRSVAADVPRGADVLVNAVCPGWARTRMGGAGAPRSEEEGAESIVWAATLPSGGPHGGFFRDGVPVPW